MSVFKATVPWRCYYWDENFWLWMNHFWQYTKAINTFLASLHWQLFPSYYQMADIPSHTEVCKQPRDRTGSAVPSRDHRPPWLPAAPHHQPGPMTGVFAGIPAQTRAVEVCQCVSAHSKLFSHNPVCKVYVIGNAEFLWSIFQRLNNEMLLSVFFFFFLFSKAFIKKYGFLWTLNSMCCFQNITWKTSWTFFAYPVLPL